LQGRLEHDAVRIAHFQKLTAFLSDFAFWSGSTLVAHIASSVIPPKR
jgi:hypothetical protein